MCSYKPEKPYIINLYFPWNHQKTFFEVKNWNKNWTFSDDFRGTNYLMLTLFWWFRGWGGVGGVGAGVGGGQRLINAGNFPMILEGGGQM